MLEHIYYHKERKSEINENITRWQSLNGNISVCLKYFKTLQLVNLLFLCHFNLVEIKWPEAIFPFKQPADLLNQHVLSQETQNCDGNRLRL